METRLGVRLLNRTTRERRTPTDAGERLLSQLRRPLLDGLFDAAIESGQCVFARSLPATCASPCRRRSRRLVLAPVLARFSRLYPEIVIEATVESGFTDIVAGRYDAGFRR